MNEQEGLARAQAYCSAAEHCKADVRAMLERKNLEPDAIERILKRLEEDGFIDEGRYARAFVHDKVRFDRWGRIKIAQALAVKRIPRDIVYDALLSIDEDEYMAALRDVVNARLGTVKGATDYEIRMKTMKSVAARGYEPSLIGKMLDL